MMYPSKISRTRKRLSDDRWAIIAIVVSFCSLFAILTFALRAVTLSGVYGIVPAEMPVVSTPVADPAYHRYREETRDSVSRRTPAVVLTTEAFYFGDLESFTTNFANASDKFMIRHIDGEPQLAGLVETMSTWLSERAASENVPVDRVLVLIPSGEIPMPIVIQVIAGLRRAPHFRRVVLGSGLI